MRIVAVVLLLAGLALPLAAQPVTFRGGEHATFSRLVLDIRPGTPWRLGRLGGDYALDLGQGVAFDLSAAFDRIPRDRVAALSAEGETGRLVLRLGCACHATAFLFRPDKLVVDVVDGAPPPGSPFETAAESGSDPPATATLPLLPLLPGRGDLLFDPPLPAVPAAVGTARTAVVPAFDPLAEGLSLAVAAGLLDAPPVVGSSAVMSPVVLPPVVSSPVIASPGVMRPVITPPVTATGGPAAAPPLLTAGAIALPGVSFIPADTPLTRPGPRDLSQSGDACRPDRDVDLAAWSPTGEFARDLGALRGRLVDAAGGIDPEAVLGLARGYLHHGFGAEAARTLAIGSADSTEARFLGLLAGLVDGEDVPRDALAGQEGCLGAIALWTALARGTLEGSTAAERTAVETAVRILPPGPRLAVMPRVAAMFLDAGHPRTAEDLLTLVPADAGEAVLLLRSDIAAATVDAAAARSELLDAIRQGTRAGSGTMVRLTEASLVAGQPIEPWMIDTLGALRFEEAEGPMAGPLALAEVRALTAADRFEEAVARIVDPDLPVGPDERSDLADALAVAVADRAGDARFLQFAFGEVALPVSGPGAHAIARRLIALGFPEAALALVDRPAESGAMRERRLLRAEALRALGQEEEAALVLAGMGEDESTPFDPVTDWRAGDWDALRAAEDPLLAAAAAALLADGPTTPPDDTLAARAALLAGAAETREFADALLARFPAPPATGSAP